MTVARRLEQIERAAANRASVTALTTFAVVRDVMLGEFVAAQLIRLAYLVEDSFEAPIRRALENKNGEVAAIVARLRVADLLGTQEGRTTAASLLRNEGHRILQQAVVDQCGADVAEKYFNRNVKA